MTTTPRPVTVTVGAMIRIAPCPPEVAALLHGRFDFLVPQYRRLRDRVERTVKTVTPFVRDGDDLLVPYGLLPDVRALLPAVAYQYQTIWGMYSNIGVEKWECELTGSDRASQETALTALADAHRAGVYGTCLIAPCGAGKTRLGMRIIGQLKQPTLVLVHTRELMQQWQENIRQAFPRLTVGQIGDGKRSVGDITVGMIQTVTKRTDDIASHFGIVILDEAHHCPACTFTDVMNEISATVRIGLTASKARKDGMHPLLYATIGPVIAEIAQQTMVEERSVVTPVIRWVQTGWAWSGNAQTDYTGCISAMVADPQRNAVLCREIERLARAGRHTLVLSTRVDHLEALYLLLEQRIPGSVQVLHGQLGSRVREIAMERMVAGFPVTLATTSLAKEGLDAPVLDALLWATPVAGKGTTVQQSVGRVQRARAGKPTPIVVDFCEGPCADNILFMQARGRRSIYRHLGSIEE